MIRQVLVKTEVWQVISRMLVGLLQRCQITFTVRLRKI